MRALKATEFIAMNDREIIDLYFARNDAAVSETMAKYGRMLRSIAYGILHNSSDSEECENDTYLAAWNRIPPLRPKVFSAFLGRIARNLAINRYRYYAADKRNRALEVALDELVEILPGGEPAVEASAVAECVARYLSGKSRAQRIVFVRRYWYCDSVNQIATDCGFSESKVKSMLMRMRRELRLELERSGIRA